jgi:hypothetical protein
MYRFIFYFFYRYFLYRNDNSPRFGAICGVFLTIGFHFLLLYVIIQKLVGHNLLNPLSENYSNNKFLSMLIFIPFLFLTISFFNKKRTDGIINYYDNKQNVFSLFSWALFIALTIIPLGAIIFLLSK